MASGHLTTVIAALLVALPLAAGADTDDASTARPSADSAAQRLVLDTGVAVDSPRSSLEQYLIAAANGDYAGAAEFLEIGPGVKTDPAELARRFKAVLDRHIWFDMATISPASTGVVDDNLPPGVDLIGTLTEPDGATRPVQLVKRAGLWRFPPSVVARIDVWYDQLENQWFIERLPTALLKLGPHGLAWWQWMAMPLLILFSLTAGRLAGRLTRSALSRVVRGSAATWDDALLAGLAGPLIQAWTLAVLYVSVDWLVLRPAALEYIRDAIAAFGLITLFWALARSVDVGREVLSTSRWAAERPTSRALVPLVTRVAKVLLWAMGAVALLSQLGYPVASILAGLGIGGLALALAAQKTVENLFGAFSIGVDQPFREGDFVKVEDFVGTVESIGLRSTRFRTLDRTVVSIPNGRLADMRIETFAERDRIRLHANLGIIYETTADQLEAVITGIEASLRAHPQIWPDAMVVKLKELGDSALVIEVMAWFQTSDFGEFQSLRQGVLFEMMRVVERAGTSFAYPTTTVHMARA